MANRSGPLRICSDPNVTADNNTSTGNNGGIILQSGSIGSISSPPVDAIIIKPTANSAAANILTVTNAAMGQATALTIPDPGGATAKVLLDTGTNATGTFTAATITTLTGTTANVTNVNVGASGTAGTLKVFPATASRGDLKITCSNQTGNTEVIVNAAAMGQATTVTLPDPGVATTSLLLLDNAGTQTIATGSLALTAGSVTATAGNLVAGSSGNAGTVSSFPATGSKGSLKLAAVNNTGNTITTISNAAMGQASVISIPDPAGATANFNISPAALVNNNFPVASGTAGLLADSGSGIVTVTLNTAAVTGAYGAPFQLIASPGSGKALVITAAALYTNSTGQTAFATGGVGVVQYDTTVHGAGTNALSGTIAAANITAASSQILGGLLPSTAALTSITNKGIYFSNQTGAFTNGTGSSLVFVIEYLVITATV